MRSVVLFPSTYPPAKSDSESVSGSEDKGDEFIRRDPRLCSALLQNPAFINPWASFIFANAAMEAETHLDWAAFAALGLFNFLLGRREDGQDLQYELVSHWPSGRWV